MIFVHFFLLKRTAVIRMKASVNDADSKRITDPPSMNQAVPCFCWRGVV